LGGLSCKTVIKGKNMTKIIWQDGIFITVEDDYKESNTLDSNGKKDFFLQENNNLNPDDQHRMNNRESNSSLCWFCKKNEPDLAKTVEVPLYKTIRKEDQNIHSPVYGSRSGASERSGKITTYNYLPAKVLIPRCRKCAKAHNIISLFFQGFFALLLIFLILALGALFYVFISHEHNLFLENPWSACLYLPATFITAFLAETLIRKNYMRSKGTSPLSDKKLYPEVFRLLADGYKIGESPVNPGSPDE
jgi:hypothetical protein